MRIYLTAAILLGLLAGCSSDQSPSDGKTTAAANSALRNEAALPFAARSTMSSFASLPDRGELLAYSQDGKVKQSGAYTAYPVAISEAHALHAMQSGEMVVKAPNGELIRLKYKSHVESPDGNWSWIGTNADGVDAILTFGEKAVFGTIPQGKTDALRLTMNAGQSWLVQTDRAKLVGLDGAKGRDGTDQMVPPKLSSIGSEAMSLAAMRAEPATANATASPAVIDVLLGYTNGFVTENNGASGAVTRLNFLVVTANQAYARSGISMRVRLVGTLQVNYADNTDNGDALEKLTGYTSGTGGGQTTPDPAFNALRAKRDELGADLVSLVRAFRTPENNGCGIAWLIGGGQSGITPGDAPFGYSVVSDGDDKDEGDGHDYFCRDETLAHEMGHNMGQAHNQEDSDGSGIHAYSYGYRESSSTGFYTVMAYPLTDGNQFGISYFANPAIKYDNRPTGVANQSDNARSMNETMPVVAAFRSTVVPEQSVGFARGDIDGNGKSDILFRYNKSVANNFNYWIMNGPTVLRTGRDTLGASYRVAATGDFNRDGKLDLIWTSTSRDVLMWRGTGTSFVKTSVGTYGVGWSIVGAGDIDGDGRSDLLFRYNKSVANNFQYWIMNGASVSRTGSDTLGASYSLAATGDFNRDGKADLAWTSASRDVVMWRSNGTGFVKNAVGTYGSGWSIVGAADIDGDSRSDLLFRYNKSVANNFNYWVMNGPTIVRTGRDTLGASYSLAATGDYNGDGKGDLIWTSTSHDVLMWRSNGTAFVKNSVGSYGAGWSIVSP